MIRDVLNRLKEKAKTKTDQGDLFEILSKIFLENDPLHKSQYVKIYKYEDWAVENDEDEQDEGIDLVAKLANEDGYCAIQCKFYKEDRKIQRSDIDSFITASSKEKFKRRLYIDTTSTEWGTNAEKIIKGLSPELVRIGLKDFEKSTIDWSAYAIDQIVVHKPPKEIRPHQQRALYAVTKGLASADRGKLIMACGTGKTYTSLKIAEKLAGRGKSVLYLVPSLALMAQTVREWSNDSAVPLYSFAVCSDVQVGRRKVKDDLSDLDVEDLALRATTNPQKLANEYVSGLAKNNNDKKMAVVFATYQSIQVIADAQQKYDFPEFDLVICDEAHRTTGAKLKGEHDSNFVKVHSQDYIRGKKRLYMTATPRIYGDTVKVKAREVEAVLCSMDDESLFGETFHEISFSEAVSEGLLTDYKVVVLAVNEAVVSASVQKRLADANSELVLDDATKIIGCYRALAKIDLKKDLQTDQEPMRRAVAFCKDIKSSKLIRDEFGAVISEYLHDQQEEVAYLQCDTRHVDGTFNAKTRTEQIDWLNSVEHADNKCHILSNARCLSEGVDVPALDAILFLHPRKSQIDVVQTVGRVMRQSEGKKLGYVILPVGVPADMSPEEALNNNKKYRVIWQILNALRAHDDRLDSDINKIDLGEDISSKIEVISVVEVLPSRDLVKKPVVNIGGEDNNNGLTEERCVSTEVRKLETQQLQLDEFQKAVLARIVRKCGNRDYLEDWADDVADIAKKHISRINGLISNNHSAERQAFNMFLEEMQNDLNKSVTEADAVEMLAQHLITKPVFDALFEGYSFAKNNPVSQSMEKVLNTLKEQNLEKESEPLRKFYSSIRRRVEGIVSSEAKQKIIIQLYDKFFRNAFERTTKMLGIVYTPVPIVDFIIHSVNDILKLEFGKTLGSKGVHILDPFTGTGTFITRLLQSGLILPTELKHKYEREIHANEIVLLAYYIATINIEQVYHDLKGGGRVYTPFNGICLTDTFNSNSSDLVNKLLIDNNRRLKRQKDLDIRVILGNPPYSVGKKRANDNTANVDYPDLDKRINETYAKNSSATLTRNLNDTYIRAIRWASDRLGDSGIMCFVSGSSWINKSFADGMRKSLQEEFSSIYVFNLRGEVRKKISNENSTQEGENVFGGNTMTGIAISLFVKQPNQKDVGRIYYHDIGDGMSTEDKLCAIKAKKSINGITDTDDWTRIIPNSNSDWIDQRNSDFEKFIEIGNKKNKSSSQIFNTFSLGISTNRDAWSYNSSKAKLIKNMQRTISFYNIQLDKIIQEIKPRDYEKLLSQKIVSDDPEKISWSRNLLQNAAKKNIATFDESHLRVCSYRPFFKRWHYHDPMFIGSIGKVKNIFPMNSTQNRVICLKNKGSSNEFFPLMTDVVPDLHILTSGAQCFPLKLYEIDEFTTGSLYSEHNKFKYKEYDGISERGLAYFQDAYPDQITKDDLFYYIYALLHSEEYHENFANNLGKQLPRIPRVKKIDDFREFSKAGFALSSLHVDYEQVNPYPVKYLDNKISIDKLTPDELMVEKMKFAGSGKEKDKSTVIYNSKITMINIPIEAYDYVVSGKSALEWVMSRQCVRTDKDSGIVNDANDYAIETVGDPAYPLKLFQKIITVSLETMKIVKSLPELDILEEEDK